MSQDNLGDGEGKDLLKEWPERPTKLFRNSKSVGFWLRAQPPDALTTGPTLVTPGATVFKTQPDGLWLWFGDYAFVDVIAVEVCRGRGQNLNDKRSRYMPTNHALLADCKSSWLLADVAVKRGRRPRWVACGTISKTPTSDTRIPVRHIRVLYAIPDDQYDKWLTNVTPGAYEFFCRHSSLGSHTADGFRKFLSRMMPGVQYYTRPKKP